MAATVTLVGDVNVSDPGGSMILARVDWGGDTPWALRTKCRLRVFRRSSLLVYSAVQDCFSGIPGQMEDYGGGSFGPVCYPEPTDQRNDLYLRVVKGFVPKLAPGVYWVGLQYYDTGTSTWLSMGDPQPIRVHPRSRFQMIYSLRKRFPGPPYRMMGPKELKNDPLIVG